MFLHDAKLENLKNYNGISPCPEDIDEYWDRAIEEMNGVDPNVELVPASFSAPGAECFDMFFTGVRNARIHARLLRPKNIDKPCPAVLTFHGYAGYIGEWYDKLSYVYQGYVVAILDCRGQMGISEDTGGVKGSTFLGHVVRGIDDDPDNLLMRHTFLDAAELAKIVMSFPYVDENKIGAFGQSQGGALTVAVSALVPEIKRLAPSMPFLCDYRQIVASGHANQCYDEIGKYFRFLDPLHKFENEFFMKLGYIDIQNIAKRVKGEVMLGVGLSDSICPPITQFAMYNKLTAQKQFIAYPDFGHENLPGFADKTFEFMMGLKD